MSRLIPIQLKAAFLLIIFSLNMMVGFACAVGINMGFNNTHHPDSGKIHVHASGKKHHHESNEQKHSHKRNNGKDNCCTDKVLKISQTDKAVPQVSQLVNPVFFTAYISTYYLADIFYPSQVNTFKKHFVRGHHPPIPDIRIAIQSFQI